MDLPEYHRRLKPEQETIEDGLRRSKKTLSRRRPSRTVSARLVFLAMLSLACAAERPLAIRAAAEGGVPLGGLEITILPVNPDALLDSLAAAAREPRPAFPQLEAAMAAYRLRDRPAFGGLDAAWRATRDSVSGLADSLRGKNRAAPAYREAYDRLRSLNDRLAQRQAERDRAIRSVIREDRELAQRAAQAADSLRRWERVAFASYPERLADAVARSGRDPHHVSTDTAGTARAEVPPGRWWIHARMPHPQNPFQELYWNLPVTTNRLVPTGVVLSGANAAAFWRH